jgi:Superinfection immunity protein
MFYNYYYQPFWYHGASFGLVAFLLYFLPTIVAFVRGHHHRVGILLLNFFFGWSGLGWIVALVWSLSPVHYYYWREDWGPPPWFRGPGARW